ncbi:MAG: ABC transporter ATP-binding protein, partial [Desulfobacterales bacterium]|nr:ABC transporter ATP-binding protein [Desulfobacterales bacterium]
MSKKEFRRRRSAIVSEKGRVLKPIEDQIEQTEEAIIGWEAEIEELNRQIQAASGNKNGTEISRLSRQLNELRQKVDEGFADLERLSSNADARRAEFDAQLEELEARKPF